MRSAAAGSAALVWFRRDLRDYDHAPLAAALADHAKVHCAFVFDTEILDALAQRRDPRVAFIHASVLELNERLRARGGGLRVLHGRARDLIPRLADELGVDCVYLSRDYEPRAVSRDAAVAKDLAARGIATRTFKDQVIFESHEVLTGAGETFSVFTPYRNAWLRRLSTPDVAAYPCDGPGRLQPVAGGVPSLASIGFEPVVPALAPGMSGAARRWADFRKRLSRYAQSRDVPALEGTSRLSVDLRFGTVSVRELVRVARGRQGEGAATWLSELAWREFNFALLAARPDSVDHALRPVYDALAWEDDDAGFQAWCEGATGYPLVDAAMRELAAQGTMHNRLRMVAASFLVKDLGIDWRRGEGWFAARLLDYDQANNVANWQWCASTGADGQPWFRIFNPVTQSRRFDPAGEYIRRWVPELGAVPQPAVHAPWELSPLEQDAAGCRIGRDYPAPIVDHETARKRTLARYERVRSA